MIELVLWLARSLGLFALARRITRRRLRILCYHGIWMGPSPHFGDRLFMSPDRFKQRMHALRDAGYFVLPLAEAWKRCREGRLTGRELAITLDDGWAGSAVHMRPVLKELGWPSTLYLATHDFLIGAPVPSVTSTWLSNQALETFPAGHPLAGTHSTADRATAMEARIRALPDRASQEAEWRRLAEALGLDMEPVLSARSLHLMTRTELKQCVADGMDVQLHTHTHDLGDMSAAKVAEELATNRKVLSEELGLPPSHFSHFCYPSGVYDAKAFEPLAQEGIQTATTTAFGLATATSNPLALPRILDGESMSDLALEARLSGFWFLLNRLLMRRT